MSKEIKKLKKTQQKGIYNDIENGKMREISKTMFIVLKLNSMPIGVRYINFFSSAIQTKPENDDTTIRITNIPWTIPDHSIEAASIKNRIC